MKPYTDKVVSDFIEYLSVLNDGEREAIFAAIFECFCRHCGSSYLPCYCMRDD